MSETREREDAFYGGYCACLTVALYGDDGTSTAYLAAVRAVNARKLLAYARREQDTELPNIRRAIRDIERRARENRSLSAKTVHREPA